MDCIAIKLCHLVTWRVISYRSQHVTHCPVKIVHLSQSKSRHAQSGMDALWGIDEDDWLSCEASLWPARAWQASALSGSSQRHHPTHNISIVDGDQSSTGETPRRTFSSPQTSRSDNAVQMQGLPSDLLGSNGLKPKASGLICGPRSPTDNRRQLAAARWDSNAYRDQPLKDGKSKSKNELKALSKNDFGARHIRGFNQLELLTENEVPGDIHDRFEQTQGSCHTQFPLLDAKGKRGCRQEANNFTVPYESHIGAILGSRFRISAYIHSEACYDVYAVKDLFHEEYCLAKAYTVRGTKGKERDARLKNLKRSSKTGSLMASIDQSGKKWLVCSANLDLGKDKEVSLDPLAWREDMNYQTHFPSIDSNNINDHPQQITISKSYASCFQVSKDSTQGRPTTKAQRARDRQRRKRKEKRATQAAARAGDENKKHFVEAGREPVEPVTSYDLKKSSQVVALDDVEEDQRSSTEPAHSRCSLEAASSAEAGRSDEQEARSSKSLEQAHLECQEGFTSKQTDPVSPANLHFRNGLFERGRGFAQPCHSSSVITTGSEGGKELSVFEHSEEERIFIPCSKPKDVCLGCVLNLTVQNPGFLRGSRFHIISFGELRQRSHEHQAIWRALLPSKSPSTMGWVEMSIGHVIWNNLQGS